MTFFEFAKGFTFSTPVFLVIGLSIGFYYYKLLDNIHKSLVWYFVAMLLADGFSRLLGATGNNLIGLLVYCLFEMTLFTCFYFKYLFKIKHKPVLLLYAVACAYILWEIANLESADVKGFQSYAKVADDFVIIVLTLTFFHERINIFKEAKWDNFLFNVIVLIFFSINLVFILPLNFMINDSLGIYFWFGNNISIVLFYSYLTHSIWKNGRTQKLLLSGLR